MHESVGRVLAWGVHALTATGTVLALLALDAVEQGDWRKALLWLFAALVVDGVDGTLARATRVAERVPRIDGAALDLVIDYLNYVLVPALLIWRADLLPATLAIPLTASILLSSLYVFARRDMKTPDGYFRGFPALWNVVAAYLILTQPAQWVGATTVVVLVVLTFAPIHVIHPFRARDARLVAPVLAVVWAASTAALLLPNVPETWRDLLLGASLLTLAGLTLLGLIRTVRGERKAAA